MSFELGHNLLKATPSCRVAISSIPCQIQLVPPGDHKQHPINPKFWTLVGVIVMHFCAQYHSPWTTGYHIGAIRVFFRWRPLEVKCVS